MAGETFFTFHKDYTLTGKTLSNCTVVLFRTAVGLTNVSQANLFMEELMKTDGVTPAATYKMWCTDLTERALLSIYPDSDPTKQVEIMLDPVDGNIAKGTDLAIVAGYIDTEIQSIIDAIAALQADLGDPSGAGTTLQAEISALLARLTSTRAALLDNLDGKVSERPTSAQIAALFNAGTPATPVVFTTGRRIVVARGDKIDWPFNHGARYDCTGGKRVFFYWKEKLTDTTLAGSVECTLTDALNVSGVVPLTPSLLPAVFEGYYEYKRYDADGTSNPLTIEQGKFIIAETVKH